MAAKRASEKAISPRVFGQARKPAKMFRAGLYARVPAPRLATRNRHRDAPVPEASPEGPSLSGPNGRGARPVQHRFRGGAPHPVTSPAVAVRMHRCRPPSPAWQWSSPAGWRIPAGRGSAAGWYAPGWRTLSRTASDWDGRQTAAQHTAEVRKLHRAGVSKSEVARRLQIGRTSVRRILTSKGA